MPVRVVRRTHTVSLSKYTDSLDSEGIDYDLYYQYEFPMVWTRLTKLLVILSGFFGFSLAFLISYFSNDFSNHFILLVGALFSICLFFAFTLREKYYVVSDEGIAKFNNPVSSEPYWYMDNSGSVVSEIYFEDVGELKDLSNGLVVRSEEVVEKSIGSYNPCIDGDGSRKEVVIKRREVSEEVINRTVVFSL